MNTASLCPRCLLLMRPTLKPAVYACPSCSKHWLRRIDTESETGASLVEVELLEDGAVVHVKGNL